MKPPLSKTLRDPILLVLLRIGAQVGDGEKSDEAGNRSLATNFCYDRSGDRRDNPITIRSVCGDRIEKKKKSTAAIVLA